MMRTRLPAVAVLALLLPVGAWVALRADEPARPAAAQNEFAGKILVVRLRSAGAEPVQLEKVDSRRLGDHWFLVGNRYLDGRSVPAAGRIWVSVQEIVTIEEFADRDQYRKLYSSRER